MSSRKIKEEMLEIVAPEIYAPRRRRSVKVETKTRIKVPKDEIKSKRKWRRPGMADIDEVEILGATAPRRPYQWRGRRVQRILRPGTAVVFTPGARSRERASKRSSDEMFADADILEQFESGDGEFRYGKRGRSEALVLDASNPTPSMQPVTPQVPIMTPSVAAKRGASAVPTVQVLAPKKRRIDAVATDDVFVAPSPLSEMDTVEPGTAVLLPSRAVKRVRKRRGVEEIKSDPMVLEEVKVRDVKPIAPGIGVQTIDVKVPAAPPEIKPPVSVVEKMDISTAPASRITYGPASKIFPQYRQHPSQMGFPKVVRTRRRAVRRRRRRAAPIGVEITAARRRALGAAYCFRLFAITRPCRRRLALRSQSGVDRSCE
ncbi:V [Bovine mastadenovirus A]|uniref:V n=1 Tax=Bovine mastadenovirus A TaxID=129953 RepID=UPI0000443F90|nr:V [Bovine mastadenovirus A]